MMEDRPPTEFELDCIIEAQFRLQKMKKYLSLQKRILNLSFDITPEIRRLCQMNFEAGYWNGEQYAIVKFERLSTVPTISANDEMANDS